VSNKKRVKLSTFIVRVWETENTTVIPHFERTVEAVNHIGALNRTLKMCYGPHLRRGPQKIISANVINAIDGSQKSFTQYRW